MGRPLEALVLSESERAELGALASRRKTAQALAMRARIVLLAGDGIANKVVAARLGVDPVTVGKWRRRFLLGRRMGCGTSRAVALRAPWRMPGSRR